MKKYLFVFLALGLLIYSVSVTNSFVWEDHEQIADNPYIKNIMNLSGFFRGGTYFNEGKGVLDGNLYRPLMVVYFSLISAVSGTQAPAFHLVQVALHIINACLVFIFLSRFISITSSFWMSLIFLVHPINSEAVSYISIANDPLYFLFGMLGLIFLNKDRRLMALFFLLSLFSKESGLVFLLLAFLYSFLFHKILTKKVFFSIILIFSAYLFVRLRIAHIGFEAGGFFPMERMPLVNRLLLIPDIVFFYLGTFFIPIHLSVGRQWNSVRVDLNFILWRLLPFSTALIIGIIALFRTAGNRVKLKPFVFFSLWLFIGLLPYLQIFPLNMTVAERWFYFAQIGLLGMMGVILDLHRKKWGVNYILIIIITLLSARTFIRNFDWKDDVALFRHDSRETADSYMIETGLGNIYFQEGKYKEAESYFRKSLSLFPYQPASWINLGSLYENIHDSEKAISYYEESLKWYPYCFAYERISFLRVASSDWNKAEIMIDKGLKACPLNAKLHSYRAFVMYKANHNVARAILELNIAYNLTSDNYYLDILKKIQNGEDITIKD